MTCSMVCTTLNSFMCDTSDAMLATDKSSDGATSAAATEDSFRAVSCSQPLSRCSCDIRRCSIAIPGDKSAGNVTPPLPPPPPSSSSSFDGGGTCFCDLRLSIIIAKEGGLPFACG